MLIHLVVFRFLNFYSKCHTFLHEKLYDQLGCKKCCILLLCSGDECRINKKWIELNLCCVAWLSINYPFKKPCMFSNFEVYHGFQFPFRHFRICLFYVHNFNNEGSISKSKVLILSPWTLAYRLGFMRCKYDVLLWREEDVGWGLF